MNPGTLQTGPVHHVDLDVLDRICDRAFAQMVAMIYLANNRKDKQPGDPKVGGHPAACSSSLHVLGALHLSARRPGDYVACKPHASPIDHAFHLQMRLFRRWEDGTWLDDDAAKGAMERLRKFSEPGARDVFQSYHAKTDPDGFHFLPSGTVGIPPVNAIFLSLAHRFASDQGLGQQGYDLPEDVHYWSLIGDGEFREGSLHEAFPEASERELANITWILDYNRQNLDGTRLTNESAYGKDCDRAEKLALANGWKVIQLRHGRQRQELFERPGGEAFRTFLEESLTDYEYQHLLFLGDADALRARMLELEPRTQPLADSLDDDELTAAFADLGGHDLELILEALETARADDEAPYFLVAHTIKGFGLDESAHPANHNTLPSKKEVEAILQRNGLSFDSPFELFEEGTEEAAYLAQRSQTFREAIEQDDERIRRNRERASEAIDDAGGIPSTLGVDLSLYPMVHTQQMWGQLAAKLIRIGTHGSGARPLGGAEKDLDEEESRWAPAAKWFLTMSPDVGTSTQIAPTMNARIYGPEHDADGDGEQDLPEFNARHPELFTAREKGHNHLRFEITEANVMSAVGSFGKMGSLVGIPFVPVMTVYDFFIKRALDQLYYDLYWGAEFILMGTPSGVTLSPEGAQHSWKSDIQMPGLVTWEPSFAVELDWILSDAISRQLEGRNEGRNGVLIRAVTRSMAQKSLLGHLRAQARFKTNPDVVLKPEGAGAEWGSATDESEVAALPDGQILDAVRGECLAGAYRLIDWRGYQGYEPGDNVVEVFALGSLVTEAMAATETLLELGIFANVVVVSSPELLCGILAHKDDYRHLREGLGVDGTLHLVPGAQGVHDAELVGLAGRRVPLVAVLDGEAGLLDNLGSVVGVKQITCAVRRFSKCGRPDQIYAYQSIDQAAVVDAVGRALSETALESVRISQGAVASASGQQAGHSRPHWRELWPLSGGS